jgi:hypothetical protein
MTRRLEACFFDAGDGRWRRLARVLEWSARQHCPGWAVRVAPIAEQLPPTRHGVRAHQANTLKLDHWAAVVDDAANGDELLLIDADTLIRHPLDPVWDAPFDLAYTVRPARERFPFNGGVLFVRVSPALRRVFLAWAGENRRMLRDRIHHLTFAQRYGGINQAAFGCLLERGELDGLQVLTLPCAEWNCEDSTWAAFDPDRTRILHIKSGLRHACWSILRPSPEIRPLVELWQVADREAKRALFGAPALKGA